MGKFMLMPKLDMSMEEGVIVSWMVEKGDKVSKGDLVVEIETGKVNLEVDNTAGKGVVLEFYVQPGDTVKVNEPIMYVGKEGEVPPVPETNNGGFFETEKQGLSVSVDSSDGKFEYDLAVIGGGYGGYVCAIRAAQLGARVVLFEKDSLGGVCLNRGCIPTKTLVKNAELWRSFTESEEFGISLKNAAFDWEKIIKRKEAIVTKLIRGVGALLSKHGVEVVSLRAEITSSNTVEAGGKTYKTSAVVIASGSIPAKVPLDVKDSTPVYSAEELLSVKRLPKNLLVVGGGVIGLEMASIFSSFGVGVNVVEQADDVLSAADPDVRAVLKKEMVTYGIDFYCGKTVKAVSEGKAILSDGSEVKCDTVLMAVGRSVPDEFCKGIELARKGSGWVLVDSECRTSADRVFAIGDITGGNQLAHLASAQGIFVAETLFGERVEPINEDLVPSCVFTHPEAAWVGLTTAEAENRGIPVQEGYFPFQVSGKALAEGDTRGFVKILTDSRWDEVIGVHIVGSDAVNLIAEVTAVMALEVTAGELSRIIHAHPTLSEAVMEAAGDISGMAIHV